jgi:hypothetical protein
MAGDVQVTQHGMVIGTPEYMAPEQARSEPLDHRADLFSLGSVIYAMCTGQSPFRGSATLAVIRQVCDEMPVPVRSLNPHVPKWLEEIVEHLMQKNPAERFQSASEVAELLAGFLADGKEPRILSPKVSIAQRRVRPRVWVLACLTAAALLALVPMAIWFGGLFTRPEGVQEQQRAAAGADEKKKPAVVDPKKERAEAGADQKREKGDAVGRTHQIKHAIAAQGFAVPGPLSPVVPQAVMPVAIAELDASALVVAAEKQKQHALAFMPRRFVPPTPEQTRAIGILKRLDAKFQFDRNGWVVHVVIPRGTEVDDILEDLLPLTQIDNFSLQGTKITDAGMRHVAGFKHMHQLYLGQTAITDAGVKELANCHQLSFLGLENTQVTDAGIHALANLKSLRYLNVGGIAISDASLKDIGAFKQMGFLCLYSTRVSDAGMKELQGLQELHTLLINDTDVTDAGLKELAPLKLLKKIDAKNTAVTEAGLKGLKESMPGVKVEWEATGSSRGGLGWLTAAVCIALGIAALAAGVRVFQRRQQKAGKSLTEPKRIPNSLSSPPAASPILFHCAHCQHKLRARTEKAGKMVRCPSCGSSVAVPSLQVSRPPLKTMQPKPG